MAEATLIEQMEAELAKRKDDIISLEHAIAVLKGNASNRELMNVPQSMEFQHLGTTEAVKRLLKEFGPLGTRDLADKMQDRGIKTRSKNFVATVYATLEQNKSFKRSKDGLWEFHEK